MSYGHAREIAGHDRRHPAPIDPALLATPRMLAALAGQDITTVYGLLNDNGVSQYEIEQRTGQSQSEVC